jgi:hypothetical protein
MVALETCFASQPNLRDQGKACCASRANFPPSHWQSMHVYRCKNSVVERKRYQYYLAACMHH